MKQIFIILILVALLVLTACAPVSDPNTTAVPPETTAAPEQTTAIEGTTLPGQALFSPVPQPDLWDTSVQEEYGYSFIYSADPEREEYFEYYLQLDATQCKEGYLYRYNRHTKELIQILDKQIATYTACGFGYLYVPEKDKTQLLWTDAFGDEQFRIYTARHTDISGALWNKNIFEEETDIYVLEGDSHILRLKAPDWTPEVLYHGEGITGFQWRADENYLAVFKGEDEYHLHSGMDEPVKQPCPHHCEEMSDDQLAELTQLLTFSSQQENWHNYALKSTYESAADIDLLQLFYSAPWMDFALTQEEKNFLSEKGMAIETSLVHKYPVEKMNAVLTKIFGITLPETNGVGLDKMIYNPDTDSYYHLHGDFSAVTPTILRGTVLYDGKLVVYYTSTDEVGRITEKAVTLQPDYNGNYTILSNQIVP